MKSFFAVMTVILTRKNSVKVLACAFFWLLGVCGFAAEPQDSVPLPGKPRLLAQLGHVSPAHTVLISPDGRYLVTADYSEVILWDRASGREIRRFTGHEGNINDIAFSPTGKHVAIASDFDHMARLWDIERGAVVQRFKGHSKSVTSLAFHPNGVHLLTGSLDRTVRLWDVTSGFETRRLEAGDAGILAVAVSPDGRLALAGGWDKTARVWDLERDTITLEMAGHQGAVDSVTFHPSLQQALTTSRFGLPRLWDLTSGTLLRTFQAPTRCVWERGGSPNNGRAAFAPSGRYVLADFVCVNKFEARKTLPGGDGRPLSLGAIELWETATGVPIHTFGGASVPEQLWAATFSGENQIITADYEIRFWDIPSGNLVRDTGMRALAAEALGFSDEGAKLWVTSNTNVRIWDTQAGLTVRRFSLREFNDDWVGAPSPDGRYLVTGHDDGTVRFNDIANAGEPRVIIGHKAPVNFIGFSDHGEHIVTASDDGSARVWRTDTGELVQTLSGHDGPVVFAQLSADLRFVLTGSKEIPSRWASMDTVRVWALETGREVSRFDGEDYSWFSFTPAGHHLIGQVNLYSEIKVWDPTSDDVAHQYKLNIWRMLTFSPDGEHAIGNTADGPVLAWRIDTGEVTHRFVGHTNLVWSLTFSPDGRRIVTTSRDKTARVWNWVTGREVAVIKGHEYGINDATFSPDGRIIATAGGDHVVGLWNATTGAALAKLVNFPEDQWAVTDPLGRFDASRGGDIDGLHWIVANEPVALSQLKSRYYDPGLLAKNLGWNTELPRPVDAFADPELFPSVDVNLVEPDNATLRIRLINRGGGIGHVIVNLNGKEVTADARDPSASGNASRLVLDLPIADHPYLLPGKDNEIEVLAFNRAGYLSSRGVRLVYSAPGVAAAHPTLWAVVVGISDYDGSDIDLRFAAKDAADMATALGIGAKRLFGADNVNLQLLLSSANNSLGKPSKPNLERAFSLTRNAAPHDILVVYLAGHGVAVADDYYYLTEEARSTDLEDPEVRRYSAISSTELIDWLKRSPALKQVMILDTCAAGQAVVDLVDKRSLSSSQMRAIERLADRTGFHVLMGSAADAVSYEASQYQQGLLTYALLQGMKGPALREQAFVDVSRLFQYAADEVPRLAKHLGGIQRPRISAPRGTSFDVGHLTPSDRTRIPLSQAKRLLLNPVLQNAMELYDNLGLTEHVRVRLREVSYADTRSVKNRMSNAVYIDAEALPGAIKPSGTYRVEGPAVIIDIVLVRDGEKLERLEIRGDVHELEALAKETVERVLLAIDEMG